MNYSIFFHPHNSRKKIISPDPIHFASYNYYFPHLSSSHIDSSLVLFLHITFGHKGCTSGFYSTASLPSKLLSAMAKAWTADIG